MRDEFNLQQYDSGARYYDPAIARWNSPDPLADLAANWTPFRYGFNNPMTFSDPSGMMETSWDGQQSVSATTGTMAPGSLKPSGTIKYMDGVRVSGSGRSNGGPITIKTIDPNNGPTFIPSISVTSLNLPPVACPEISGGIQSIDYTAVPPSPPETVSEYEPTMWDGLYNLGNNMRQDGNYLMGFAADLSYNMTNDAYISYNWVIHKESYDLRGVQTGYTKAVRCATFSWASILSLPLGWMGEVGEITNEGAKLSSNGVKLSKQLASEAQIAEKGIPIIGSDKLKDTTRLARQYGGDAAQCYKISSSSFIKKGVQFETHWYENIITGLRVEFKTALK